MKTIKQTITKQIDTILQQNIDSKQKCISNTLLFQSSKNTRMIYFAKNKNKPSDLVIVCIDVSSNEKAIIKFIPVEIEQQSYSKNISLHVSQCSFTKQAFMITIYDTQSLQRNHIKSIHIGSYDFNGQLKGSFRMQHFYTPKRQNQIKDIKWHAYSPLTVIILLSDRILIYHLGQSTQLPVYDLDFKDMKVENNDEIIIRNNFQKISFATRLNQSKTYSSLGKKLSFFLISSKGVIYMVFPIVGCKVIINRMQNDKLQKIKSYPQNKRQHQMAQLFRDLTIQKINKEEETIVVVQNQQFQQAEYKLGYNNRSSQLIGRTSKAQIFRLQNSSSQKNNSSSLMSSIVAIQDFHVVTISCHTLFISTYRTRGKQGGMKVEIFTQDPYGKLLQSDNYLKRHNFNIQTVGQLKIDKVSNQLNINPLQVFYTPSTNNIYLLCNNSVCYKMCLDGLYRLVNYEVNSQQQQRQQNSKLTQIDVIFQSRPQIISLGYGQQHLYLLRHDNKSYTYNQIPLKSTQIKQKIKEVNMQTQDLFKKLAASCNKANQIPKHKDQKIILPELKQSSLIELKQKLQRFTNDYRGSIERKFQRIRDLYQLMKTKQHKIQIQTDQRQKLFKLIQLAQQNDEKIKQIVTSSSKQKLSTDENQLKRRLKASQKMLKQLTDKITRESYAISQNPRKMQVFGECQQQADGIIGRLEELRNSLMNKKRQLQRQLGYKQ